MSEQRQFHPVADIFPLMPDDELQALADDIKTNGLQLPIVVDSEGRIVDGRHRYLACERAGVEPEFRVTTDDDFVALVASLNVKRRNLTSSQKAMAAAEAWDMIPIDRGRPSKNKPAKNGALNGERREILATMFGVGRTYVDQARKVLLRMPEAAKSVKDGTMQLSEAYPLAQEQEALRSSRASLLDELRGAAPDLAELVTSGKLQLPEARAAAQQREQENQRQRRVAMASLRQVLTLIAPAGGTVEDKAQLFIEAWSPADFDEGGIGPLTSTFLRAGAEVLLLLAKHAEEGEAK